MSNRVVNVVSGVGVVLLLNGCIMAGSGATKAPNVGAAPDQGAQALDGPAAGGDPANLPLALPASGTDNIMEAVQCSKGAAPKEFAYNALILDSATLSSADVQGRLGVAHDASLTDYSVGDVMPKNAKDFHLLVGGNLSLNRGTVANGAVGYGGTLNAVDWIFFTPALKVKTPDFSAAASNAQLLSAQLAAMPANGTLTPADASVSSERVMAGTSATMNVFSISTEQLSKTWRLTINAPATSTVVVNVFGASASLVAVDLKTSGVQNNHIIFNFANAKTLEIRNVGVEGSILAPTAQVNYTSGVIHGFLIAKSLTGNGQVNLVPFTGCVSNPGPGKGYKGGDLPPPPPPPAANPDQCPPKGANPDNHPGQSPYQSPKQGPSQSPDQYKGGWRH